MPTVAWILIFGSGMLIRQVVVGRAGDTPTDLQDFFVAALRGDYATVSAVAARRGSSGDAAVTAGSGVSDAAPTTVLLTEMRRLGVAAKGYRLGATGPEYFDCSGLVWRAMRNLGYTSLDRFITGTWPVVAPKYATKVSPPQVGDIVYWAPGVKPFGHMGCVSGPDRFYSALNTDKGIVEASISTLNHGTPSYWRLTGVK